MTNGPDRAAAARILLRRLGQVEQGIAFTAFLALLGILLADILSRKLSGAGLTWARQLAVYANLLVVMLGMGIASARGTHLRPRFADRWLPLSWDPLFDRLRDALMALFCLALAIVALAAVAETRQLDERSANPRWLVWPFQAVMPLAFFTGCLRHSLFACFPSLTPGEEESR
jgi:TRAP-type C4-dicarboxylate transport system permease small subunit